MSRVILFHIRDASINGGSCLKYKGICRLLTVYMACGLLSGCAGKNQVVVYEDTDQEEATITYFGNKYEPENVRVIEEILSGFMAENPDIHVSYELSLIHI